MAAHCVNFAQRVVAQPAHPGPVQDKGRVGALRFSNLFS